MTDDAVQMRAPGASVTPPSRPGRSPATPPPSGGQVLVSTAMIPPPASEPPPPPPPPPASFVGSFAAGPPAQLQIFDGHRWVGVREMVSAIDAQEAATGLVPGMEQVRDFLRRMAGEA